MGVLTALTLISSFIQLASNIGLPQALAKYVAELKGRGEDFSAYFISSIIIKTSAALLMCLILYLFSGEISSTLLKSPSMHSLVELTAIYSFIFALMPIFGNLLLGAGLLKWIAICDVASAATNWTAMILLLFLGYGVDGVIIGWILGGLCGLTLYAAISRRLIKLDGKAFNRALTLTPSLLRFSWPLLIASMVTFLYTRYDQALVIAFLPLQSVGIYNVSCRAFGVLSGISMALGQSLFPYYGMTYGRGDHKAISAAIKKATRYTMLIMFPLTLGLLSSAKPAITLFAGQQYESGWTVLAVMAIFGLTYGISSALTGLLVIYERPKTVMVLRVASVAFSLTLLPTLRLLGLNTLALIRGTSLLLALILTIHFLSKIIDVEIDQETFIKSLISSVIMAVIVYLTQQICYSKFLLPLYVLIGAAAYLIEIRAFKVLNHSDINLLTQIIGERGASLIAKLMGCGFEAKAAKDMD